MLLIYMTKIRSEIETRLQQSESLIAVHRRTLADLESRHNQTILERDLLTLAINQCEEIANAKHNETGDNT